MIGLKASRFRVSHDGDNYHVFTFTVDGCVEVTDKLNKDEKEELIDDLIYCIQDLMKKG